MTDLEAFLKAAKQRGASDEFLVALLTEQGWPRKAVYQVLGRYYAEAGGVPIPQPRSSLESAREAFFHLLAFSTLATWIFSSGSIWFELIDVWFPDASSSFANAGWHLSRVSWQMAALIVAFPAFAWATRSILRDLADQPEKQESPVRRWLTQIALLLTALVFIGDLVSFVAAFLQGELTTRFVLKSLVVFVLAGGVFLYYSRGVGKAGAPSRRWHLGFGTAALGSILLSLALGFLHAGSPAEQRVRAQDRRRTQDLHAIARRLQTEWSEHKKLPARLADLPRRAGSAGLILADPFSRQPYGYHPVEGSRYKLCASFEAATPAPPPGIPEPAWSHGRGDHCFELDAAQTPDWPAVP